MTSKSHDPGRWAQRDATARGKAGADRVAGMVGHRGASAAPKRQTSAQSNRDLARELKRNSRRNEP